MINKHDFCFEDFLKYHDEDLIQKAFLGILKRKPSASEFDQLLIELRNGKLNQKAIICKLRGSSEGKRIGVKIVGLQQFISLRRIYSLPIIGRFIRLITAIIGLPGLISNLENFENFTNSRFTNSKKEIDNANILIEELRDEIEKNIELLKQDIAILESSKAYNYTVDELKQKLIALQERLQFISKVKNKR